MLPIPRYLQRVDRIDPVTGGDQRLDPRPTLGFDTHQHISVIHVLQIDDAQTGQRLTDGPRDQPDAYQSRLSISPDRRYLMTAGDRYGNDEVMVFDLDLAVRDASALDGDGIMPLDATSTDVAAACWLDSDRVVVATTDHVPLFDDADALGPGQLGVWSVSQSRWLHRTTVGYPMGTLIACGSRVITLYGHPQLLDPITGDVIAEWPNVPIGTKQGSYEDTNFPTPIAALHPTGHAWRSPSQTPSSSSPCQAHDQNRRRGTCIPAHADQQRAAPTHSLSPLLELRCRLPCNRGSISRIAIGCRGRRFLLAALHKDRARSSSPMLPSDCSPAGVPTGTGSRVLVTSDVGGDDNKRRAGRRAAATPTDDRSLVRAIVPGLPRRESRCRSSTSDRFVPSPRRCRRHALS